MNPDNEVVQFNERTHEIVWDVGNLNNAVGVLNDPREVIFQVSILPEVNQIKTDIVLMSDTELTAKDKFTLNDIKESLRDKTTRIEEDLSVEDIGYRVVE